MPKLTVIASHAPTMRSLKQAELASYQCNSCNEETVALAGCDPFCSHCGSPAMKERKQATVASVFTTTEDPALTSAQCSNCAVANVMLDSELANQPRNDDGHVEICCVECGTGMHFKPDVTLAGAEDDESEEEGEDDWAWDGDQPSEQANTEEDSTDTSDELEEEASPEDNPMIIMPKQKPVVASAEDDEEEEEESEEESEEEEEEEEEKEEADVIQSTQNPDYRDEPEDLNIDMLDAVTASVDGKEASIAFIPMDDKILANVADQTVAVLRKTAETANADIFGTPAYMEALAHSFNANGLEPTLASYGFHRNTIKAPSALAKVFVQEKAKAIASAQSDSVVEEKTARFAQCYALASAGLTRGFFVKTPHRIKDRLISDLTTAGVQDAKGLVERALAATEDEHNQGVLELAQSLATRSTEGLNDLAETIASINPVGSANRTTGDTPVGSLESSLAEPIRKVTTTASFLPQPAVKSNSVVRNLAERGPLFNR